MSAENPRGGFLKRHLTRRRIIELGAATVTAIATGKEVQDILHDIDTIADSPYIQKAQEDAQRSPAYPPDYADIMKTELEDDAHITERKGAAAIGGIVAGGLLLDAILPSVKHAENSSPTPFPSREKKPA